MGVSRETVTVTELDGIRTQSRNALGQIAKGDPAGFKALYSRGDDVTVGNPYGGFGRGWEAVVEQIERAASYYSMAKSSASRRSPSA